MDGPDSSYSLLAIHICWKVESEARMDPPIQTEYLRSGGATTCTDGAPFLGNPTKTDMECCSCKTSSCSDTDRLVCNSSCPGQLRTPGNGQRGMRSNKVASAAPVCALEDIAIGSGAWKHGPIPGGRAQDLVEH